MASRRPRDESENVTELELLLKALEERRRCPQSPKLTSETSDNPAGVDAMPDPVLEQRADDALSQLSPGQQALIRTLYGFDSLDPQTPKTLANATGVDEARLKDAEAEALRALRRQPGAARIVKH